MAVGLAPPASAHDAESRVQVRRGETLSEIAQRAGVGQHALASANGISDRDLVYSGTWLDVPAGGGRGRSGPESHTVVPGETLWSIGQRYGISASALALANGMADPDRVVDGRTLSIPAGRSGGRPTTSGLPARLRANPARMAYIPTFDRWALAYGVPADLLKATTYLESGWQNTVVSSTGAVGIGQLMPGTVVHMNDILGTDLHATVPDQNIRMSARYLAWLISRTGSTRTALAGYYQGLTSVEVRGLYPSTIAYVEGVQALRRRF